jgi:hypothetical protein
MLLQLPLVVVSREPVQWQDCIISNCMASPVCLHNGVNQLHVCTSLQGFPGQSLSTAAGLNESDQKVLSR